MDHLERLIDRLPSLRTLDLSCRASQGDILSRKFIVALAALKHLSHFTTSCTPCQMLDDTPPPHRTPSFAALHSLTLVYNDPTARQISLWSTFIAFHDLTSLREFRLVRWSKRPLIVLFHHKPMPTTPDTRLALQELLRIISDVVPPPVLLTFCLPTIFLTFEILRPLLAFTNLKALDIRLTDLDDNACSQMAMSWPNLATLSACDMFFGPEDSAAQLSLTILGHFARHCPKLKSLHLPIGIATMPPIMFGTRPSRGYCNPRLALLGVGNCPLSSESKYHIAIFLLDHFPGLKYVEAGGFWESPETNSENIRRWKDVSDMLPALSLARSWWEAPPPASDAAPILPS